MIKEFFSKPHHFLRIFFNFTILCAFFLAGYIIYYQYNLIRTVTEQGEQRYQEAVKEQESMAFESHLSETERLKYEESIKALEVEYEKLKASDDKSVLFKVNETYRLYQDLLSKIERNSGVGIDTKESSDKMNEWGAKLLTQDFGTLTASLNEESKVLDNAYQKYLDSLPPPPPPPPPPDPTPTPQPVSAKGYSNTTVSTEKGKFSVHLIKVSLSSYRVKTVAANSSTCTNNCPTKSLADYVKENKAYAGIHGSYFCPPDYSACAGKVNSFDFAFYNSNNGRWLNSNALTWGKTGLMTFNGRSPNFYSETSSYGGAGVTAGISNYPSLVRNSKVVVNPADLTSHQNLKGVRGAIGYDDKNLYLVIVSNATVIDTAYVMKALGAKNALNLDGGGSSAMYINGSYIVGPGRSLPNAVVIVP
jgi:exopolysaccharide biosynthesis protein